MKKKIILLFQTTHETLLAEKALEESGISVKPRVKPRKISSECAMGLETDIGQLQDILTICKNKRLSQPNLFKETERKEWVKLEHSLDEYSSTE